MLFDNAINSKKQGDIGMCYAMAYYAKLGWTVSVPVTDSQDYDLVVDNGTRLFKRYKLKLLSPFHPVVTT